MIAIGTSGASRLGSGVDLAGGEVEEEGSDVLDGEFYAGGDLEGAYLGVGGGDVQLAGWG